MVTANRNGFYYALDRKTGEFLFARHAKQTWAKADEHGRPIEIPGMAVGKRTLVIPARRIDNWAPGVPGHRHAYVPVRRWDRFITRPARHKPGTYYTGGSGSGSTRNRGRGSRARREDRQACLDFRLPSPTWPAHLNAGGLVFSGSNEGNFYALDAKSGKPLWQFQTGGVIRSGPMSFLANGKQYVAVAGGHALFVFALDGA